MKRKICQRIRKIKKDLEDKPFRLWRGSMTIEISYESEKKLDIPYEDIVNKMVVSALDFENCPYEAEVSVTFVDDEEIRKINSEYRGIDKSTDVLSFPFNEFEIPGNFDNIEESVDAFNPETGELLLGDIILSTDHITEQAIEYGHSETRELAFLVVHSMLHLMGYDHMEDEDRVVMEERQRKILELEGISR